MIGRQLSSKKLTHDSTIRLRFPSIVTSHAVNVTYPSGDQQDGGNGGDSNIFNAGQGALGWTLAPGSALAIAHALVKRDTQALNGFRLSATG